MIVTVFIPLKYKNNIRVMKVDYEDWKNIGDLKWILNSKGYCRRHVPAEKNLKRGSEYLHRRILRLKDSSILVDHINRDTLDNRRCNLRIADFRINRINSKLNSNSTTGVRGVSRNKRGYRASITIDGKTCNLGDYGTIEQAEKIYKTYYEKYYRGSK